MFFSSSSKIKTIFLYGLTCFFCSSATEQHQRWWTSAELLYWSFKKSSCTTPFVTYASLSDPLPGALGNPGTKIALSSKDILTKYQLGARFLLGASINSDKKIAGEVSYLFLPTHEQRKCVTTSGKTDSHNLAVPIFDTTGTWGLNGTPGNTIALLSDPLSDDGGFSAAFNLFGRSKLEELEVNALFTMDEQDCSLLQTSLGFGWLQLKEAITFTGSSASVGDEPPAFFNFTDSFATNNNFFGALFGAREKSWHGALALQVTITGGVGAIVNNFRINGSSKTESGNLFFLTKNTGNDVLCGGIFTQPSNIGKRTHLNCAGLFELTIRGSYYLNKVIELTLGYNFILLSPIARAADQIDTKINTTRTSLAALSRQTVGTGTGPIPFGKPGPAPAAEGDCSPVVLMKTGIFWTQGLVTGIRVEF